MKNRFLKILGSGFGLGYLPWAPGTWGTLLGIPLFCGLSRLGPFAYMGITLLLIGLSILIAEMACPVMGAGDSPHFILDEVVGYLVTMVWLPVTWPMIVAGFILFRILDAWKPGPIGYLDRNLKGGLGVVVDDLAAGIAASAILQIIYNQTTWLGVRLV